MIVAATTIGPTTNLHREIDLPPPRHSYFTTYHGLKIDLINLYLPIIVASKKTQC